MAMEDSRMCLVDSVSELLKNTSCSFHLEGWPAATAVSVVCTVAIVSKVYLEVYKSNMSVGA